MTRTPARFTQTEAKQHVKVPHVKCNANASMVEGYWDGFNLDTPEPSDNRNRSYKHGFANGRADKSGVGSSMTYQQLVDAADEAMRLDEEDGIL